MSDSIFGERVRTSSPIRTDPSPPRICAGMMQTSTTIAASHDARLLAILDSDHNEPAMVAFARKERELREAFAALPILDQRALQTRLSSVRSGDLLAAKFNRLTVERRTRLINFLGDARRRAAFATQRKAG